MKRSETGAGQVGLLWVVFLIVLILGLAGFTYIAFKDKANLELQYQEVQEKEKAAFDKFTEQGEFIKALSKVVGFRGDSAAADSSSTAVSDLVTNLKDRNPDYISKDASTLEEVVSGLQQAKTALATQLEEVKRSLDREIELRKTAEENINSIELDKSRRIAELEAQVNDEQQRAQAQAEEDNQRISNLQEQLDQAESRVREAENNTVALRERLEKEISLLSSRVTAQAKKLEVLREPDLPDGSILESSPRSGYVYIDIGRQDGLRRGTKFEVFRYAKGGDLVSKGWIEVREVDEESAMAGVLTINDEYDPILKGDVVINPHFDRSMERTFVFLGSFPANLDRDFVENRLESLGAKIDERVTPDTDFLVLGEKEQSEFAPDLTESPEFKLANQLGVQVIRLKELAQYLEL